MRTMSAAFVAAIAARAVKITELYILEMADGAIYRYTTHSQDKIWDADDNTYTAIPMERTEVNFSTNFEAGEVSLAIANITLAIGGDVNNDILDRAELTIKRIRWDADYAADEEFIIFKGFLDVDFDRQSLELTAKSKFTNLAVQIPRFVYEESCNYNLFDNQCDLDRELYSYAGTASSGSRSAVTDTNRGSLYKVAFDTGTSGSPIGRGDTITGGNNAYTAVVVQIVYLTTTTGFIYYVELSNPADFEDDEVLTGGGNTVTVNGTPAIDNTFYEMGEIEMTSGANNGQQRPIALDSSGTLVILTPFVAAVATNDTYNLYPGCDLRGITCDHKFGNKLIFRGWIHVPKVEDAML